MLELRRALPVCRHRSPVVRPCPILLAPGTRYDAHEGGTRYAAYIHTYGQVTHNRRCFSGPTRKYEKTNRGNLVSTSTRDLRRQSSVKPQLAPWWCRAMSTSTSKLHQPNHGEGIAVLPTRGRRVHTSLPCQTLRTLSGGATRRLLCMHVRSRDHVARLLVGGWRGTRGGHPTPSTLSSLTCSKAGVR